MTTVSLTDNDLFKMGAATVIGDLFDSGNVCGGLERPEAMQEYLASYGMQSVSDAEKIGMRGLYLDFIKRIFGEPVD